MSIYHIYDKRDEAWLQKVRDYFYTHTVAIEEVYFTELADLVPDGVSHLVVTGRVSTIKVVFDYAAKHGVSVGIIPHPSQQELINTFALRSALEQSIPLALHPADERIDLLYCQDELVLQEVVIGEVPPLANFSSAMEKKSFWERVESVVGLIKQVRHLKHTRFAISTAKGKLLKFSAMGAVGVEYNNRTFASKLISKHLKYNDGRLSLVLLSPSSIVEYMGYIFQTHLLNRTPEKLPPSVGYIHSKHLDVQTQEVLTVTIDGDRCLQTPVLLQTQENALALSVGERFWEKCAKTKEIKEAVKVTHLPADDEMADYLGRGIPLFTHASRERFAELFTNLREESSLNGTFMTLLILATIIAVLGLYINSASVIIGAMLLAPLMQPIVGVSMGLLRQDSSLLFSGLKSIAIGVMAVMASAVIISYLLPLEQLTSEMQGRLSPTILDMFVAIISGVAAAYAKSNEKIVGSMAGVAIAVALVPPLAVSGIGLGWGEWGMFGSALLLFITNLVGIVLAASMTFLFLGFSPVSVAKKGLLYAMVLVGIVSIPLAISFNQMRETIRLQQTLSSFETTLGTKRIHLQNIVLQGREVRCEVIASDILSREEKQQLKALIAKQVGEEVVILVSFWYAL